MGIPITLNGTRMALTAGHCGNPPFAGGTGAPFGTRYTTAYPGNAALYGDWQLIYGKDYRMRIWSSSSTYHTIATGRITPKSPGDQLCHSGQTTGQICRYVVAMTGVTDYVDGILCGHLTLMTHQNQIGIPDSNGFLPGDAGGPVYYNNGTGSMIVVGIVEGVYNETPKVYSFTQLNAVSAWNSTFYVAGAS